MTAPETPETAETPTHPRVDEALASLQDAAGQPPAEQIEVYEAAHRALQETLASIDET